TPHGGVAQMYFYNDINCNEIRCASNLDCSTQPYHLYCRKAWGDCHGRGVCAPVPDACPDIWDPVCGCDRHTYSNGCYAARAGVSVAHDGECLTPCVDNIDCLKTDYCEKPIGDCPDKGVCQPRPLGCPDEWDPVCGCDGKTYPNSCDAAAAGVSVDYVGVCGTPCEDNLDCPKTHYCAKDVGDCKGDGTCQARPSACIDVWDPVCGCDGKTYSNACYAAMAGVSVNYEGKCTSASDTSDH
ncbi:MAG TPA: Kazal-type serine protease inhibitor domain-containing protein, partial [Phycisphaerae bacterium]|nr:Kazal-type serine protease inhibitor domain-containing protein [Phycisphaerae bacterium]